MLFDSELVVKNVMLGTNAEGLTDFVHVVQDVAAEDLFYVK